MPELDHLIFASPELDQGVNCIETLTGARAVAGGPHPGVGTHNALLTFDDTTYFEVIAIDPNQPDPGRPRPFGLDDTTEPKLVGYAIHPSANETIDQVAERLRSLGYDPGGVSAMSRLKPDGQEIHWRLTRATGSSSTPADGTLPFVIDWGDTPSPARSLPSMGALVSLQVHHPDADVRAAVIALDLGVETLEGGAKLVAIVDAGHGQVKIS